MCKPMKNKIYEIVNRYQRDIFEYNQSDAPLENSKNDIDLKLENMKQDIQQLFSREKRVITLQEAYDLIENASAVIIDGNALCYPSLDELTGEDHNEWLYCSWTDGEGYDYYVKFIEEPTEILFDGKTIYMKDNEDEDTEITLLS